MYVIYTCDNLIQSRVVEQGVLAACLAGKFTQIIFGQSPSNRIRGIATNQIGRAISQLGSNLSETLSLLGCTAESDLLLMLNQ